MDAITNAIEWVNSLKKARHADLLAREIARTSESKDILVVVVSGGKEIKFKLVSWVKHTKAA